jgi:hypothetical protein
VVEHVIGNDGVAGSIPALSTTLKQLKMLGWLSASERSEQKQKITFMPRSGISLVMAGSQLQHKSLGLLSCPPCSIPALSTTYQSTQTPSSSLLSG